METNKVLLILDEIISRLHSVQKLSKSQFDVCNGELFDVDKESLVELVDDLFDEHTGVTTLVNDIYSLRDTLSKFSVLVK